ncbi:MAG TPA: universal stress protein [Bacteroidia bacterium]|nr:universal stress protein [Bacteroidia bacterium]MBP7713684.1 universal stress protein [Bacteroidia bacterium]MBP8667489.1 universal stress protein [Bacteroidia bacterium]HOZ82227.1 universal stress protein [Bacteroidia bacterium]HOZ90000.1 universal stress protein [Bacteroidia bacterium]
MSNQLFEIKRILIPYDFSETAALSLEHAVFMAKLLKADIYLLHILESVSFTSAFGAAFGNVDKKLESESNTKLDEIGKQIHMNNGITVKSITEVGRIYRKIVDVAKRENIDIIIMGTHGVSGYKKFNVGTNTSKVVEEAACPVISVQTHSKKIGFKKIVLPIDNSPQSRQKVSYALAVARSYGSHICIAGLIDFSNEDNKRMFKLKVDQVEEWLLQHGVSVEKKFVEGDNLAKMTMQTAEELDADLIVIMTEQEPSITGFFLGTYATQVVNHSKIPVMAVHPSESDGSTITVGY